MCAGQLHDITHCEAVMAEPGGEKAFGVFFRFIHASEALQWICDVLKTSSVTTL
jgi:hypothetical protein